MTYNNKWLAQMAGASTVKTEVGGSSPVLVLAILSFLFRLSFYLNRLLNKLSFLVNINKKYKILPWTKNNSL